MTTSRYFKCVHNSKYWHTVKPVRNKIHTQCGVVKRVHTYHQIGVLTLPKLMLSYQSDLSRSILIGSHTEVCGSGGLHQTLTHDSKQVID